MASNVEGPMPNAPAESLPERTENGSTGARWDHGAALRDDNERPVGTGTRRYPRTRMNTGRQLQRWRGRLRLLRLDRRRARLRREAHKTFAKRGPHRHRQLTSQNLILDRVGTSTDMLQSAPLSAQAVLSKPFFPALRGERPAQNRSVVASCLRCMADWMQGETRDLHE